MVIKAKSLLLSACQWVMLDPKGMIAADEKQLLIISAALMLIVIIPVIVLTFIFAWRYRASNVKATYTPKWAHSIRLELLCWSIPAVIIIILGIITWRSSYQLDPYKPLASNQKPLLIQVIALEWKWLFIYPEQQIAAVNFVQFPINVPVTFLITAEGPMNSFHIPQLAGQIYAMAGMQTQLHLLTETIGDYRGFSANFSGEGFSEMKFIARASSTAEFKKWVKSVKQSPLTLSYETYQHLKQPSLHQQVQYFSSAAKDLFHTTIMHSMMPMREIKTHD
jgi:cytochrome o ubiquinol oxidase subunit II